MENIKRNSSGVKRNGSIEIIDFIVLAIMALLSLTPLFGLTLSGLNVLLGLIYFFVQKRIRRQSAPEAGLCIKTVPKAFRDKTVWVWIALPLLADIFSILLSKWIVPEYLNHLFTRTSGILSYDNLSMLFIQVFVLALGEEIAFRVLFQGTLSRYLPAGAAIAITSLFFALSHIAQGDPAIVIYDVVFVFLNSVFYGIAFYKTKNGYISAIAHILSNLFGIILIMAR